MFAKLKNSWLRFLQIFHIALFLSYASAIVYFSWSYLDQFDKAEITFPTYDKSYQTNYITKEIEDKDGIGNDIRDTALFLEQSGRKSYDFEGAFRDGCPPKDMFGILINGLAKRIDFNALQKKIDSITTNPLVVRSDFSAATIELSLSDGDASRYCDEVSKVIGGEYDIGLNRGGGGASFATVFIKPKGAPDIFWYKMFPKVPFFAKVKLVANVVFVLAVWYFLFVAIFGLISSILIYIFKGKIVLNPYYAFQKPKEPTP